MCMYSIFIFSLSLTHFEKLRTRTHVGRKPASPAASPGRVEQSDRNLLLSVSFGLVSVGWSVGRRVGRLVGWVLVLR